MVGMSMVLNVAGREVGRYIMKSKEFFTFKY